jgi:sugar/nucleoside kinase (ribokinase family)
MEQLEITQTSSTPLISFDTATQTMLIVGESYPENSFVFYGSVLAWLKQYVQNNGNLTLDITITYMNSSSTKCMLDLLDLLEEAAGRGFKVVVIWRHDPENPRSLELAEEFCEEVTFPFEIVAISK